VTLALRPARPGDEPALAAIHAASFSRAWPEADFARWLCGTDVYGVLGIAGADGDMAREPVAFALVRDTGADAELLSIAALPAVRRQGWGKAALRAVVDMAAQRRHARLVLEVSVANTGAMALYCGEGFMEIGRRKGYYHAASGPVDALVMARPLGP
jgi:[ribosomal protein S18]-alanine N-acetyltransferase